MKTITCPKCGMVLPIPENTEIIMTEYLGATETRNAIIFMAHFRVFDDGPTMWLLFLFGGGAFREAAWNLYPAVRRFEYGKAVGGKYDALQQFIRFARVDNLDELNRRKPAVRIKLKEGQIAAIGDIVEDRWIEFRETRNNERSER